MYERLNVINITIVIGITANNKPKTIWEGGQEYFFWVWAASAAVQDR